MNILTVEMAADLLQCGCSTIRKHAKIIGVERLGCRWLIKKGDLSRLDKSIHHKWGKRAIANN